MKPVSSLLLVLLCGVISLMGCNKDKPVNHSDCKTFSGKSTVQNLGPDSSGVEYSYDIQNKQLNIKHINAGFNCCPDEIYCHVERLGDTIQVKESEKEAGCDCNCLFDIDFIVEDVEQQAYYFSLIEPYAATQAPIKFGIDLTQYTSGSFYVQRNGYPWGL
ncbi:MAG TPA: hypothetical protein P5228_02935 [Bacteroidales bacterium]|nr:hypothetical protein [Bacteroidales bacterium]HRZ49257.1 hypothetical protein [Bacteroidales bacterium]